MIYKNEFIFIITLKCIIYFPNWKFYFKFIIKSKIVLTKILKIDWKFQSDSKIEMFYVGMVYWR